MTPKARNILWLIASRLRNHGLSDDTRVLYEDATGDWHAMPYSTFAAEFDIPGAPFFEFDQDVPGAPESRTLAYIMVSPAWVGPNPVMCVPVWTVPRS